MNSNELGWFTDWLQTEVMNSNELGWFTDWLQSADEGSLRPHLDCLVTEANNLFRKQQSTT